MRKLPWYPISTNRKEKWNPGPLDNCQLTNTVNNVTIVIYFPISALQSSVCVPSAPIGSRIFDSNMDSGAEFRRQAERLPLKSRQQLNEWAIKNPSKTGINVNIFHGWSRRIQGRLLWLLNKAQSIQPQDFAASYFKLYPRHNHFETSSMVPLSIITKSGMGMFADDCTVFIPTHNLPNDELLCSNTNRHTFKCGPTRHSPFKQREC